MYDCNDLCDVGLDSVTWEVFPRPMSILTSLNTLTKALDLARQFDMIYMEFALCTKGAALLYGHE